MDIMIASGAFGLLLFLFVVVPSAWIISEFYNRRWLRILLGVMTLIIYVFGFSYAYGVTIRFQYNNDYGSATKNLIKTSIQQIEDGNLDRVLKVWRDLDFLYNPTYENSAGYEELTEKATRLMKKEPADEDHSGLSPQ